MAVTSDPWFAGGSLAHLGTKPKGGASGAGKWDGGEVVDGPSVREHAAAHKRTAAEGGDEEGEAGEGKKKKRKKKEEIVTITRRQDAEVLNKRPITMKEIFPKEFWRV